MQVALGLGAPQAQDDIALLRQQPVADDTNRRAAAARIAVQQVDQKPDVMFDEVEREGLEGGRKAEMPALLAHLPQP